MRDPAVFSSTVNVSWTDQSNNETGSKIERRVGTSDSFTQIATVGANVTTYVNSGLARNTRYVYRMRAYNSVGNSAYSEDNLVLSIEQIYAVCLSLE
jgi:hypothetical protein